MAEKKKKAGSEPGTMDNVKKAIGKAAGLTSLKLKYNRTAARRKEAYTRLGELSYALHRPRKDSVPADIHTAIEATVAEITELSHELVELSLRIEILKADMKK